MAITKKDVEHVANLARLDLSDEEIKKFTKDLIQILGHCERLQKVDTSGVSLDLSETHPTNQLRDDLEEASGVQEDILKLAPKRKGNFFEVKEVLE